VVNLIEKNEIITGYLRKESKSSIAKRLGLSRPTVRKYINEYDQLCTDSKAAETLSEKESILVASSSKPKYKTGNRPKPAMTAEIEEIILKCLSDNDIKIKNGKRKLIMKATDIHEHLTDLNYKISYRSVALFIQTVSQKAREAFIKQDYAPGYSVEFDWGDVTLDIDDMGGEHRFKIGLFTFKHSDYRYAVLHTNENTECFLDAHKQFFESVGGIPTEMVYDNAKVQVQRMTGGDKKPTGAMIELSSYYGFKPRFTNYYSGHEKGNVEKSVEVIRRKAFSLKNSFETFAEAESALMVAVAKNNAAIKQRTGQSADAAFAEEVKFLAPYRFPIDVSTFTYASVNKYSLVYVDTHFYSVPEWLSQKKVMVRKYPDKLKFYHNDELLFETVRILKGKHQYRIDINHYLETLKKKPRAVKHSLALKQTGPWLQEIFHKYYEQKPRDFIHFLEIIKSHHLEDVKLAITKLMQRGLPINNSYIVHEMNNAQMIDTPVTIINNEIEQLCQNQLSAISSFYGLGGNAYGSNH
jgi:transposase